MVSGRFLKITIGCVAGLIAGFLAFAIVNSTGRAHWASGTVVSTSFSPGVREQTQIDVGNGVTVPITKDVPGSRVVVIDSDVLGRRSSAVDADTFKPGQRVYLRYRVGTLTREPAITGLYSALRESVHQVDRWRETSGGD